MLKDRFYGRSLNKNQKKPDGSDYTKQDIERMKQGKAPLDNSGKPIELHHENQNPKGPLKEMTQEQHRGPGNYKDNHPYGNSRPSQIDRGQASQDRQQYWKNKANELQK